MCRAPCGRSRRAPRTRPGEERLRTSLDRLAGLALPCARANGVLLAPIGQARAVRDALAHDLPPLLVCDENEWPRELKPALRGSIDLT